MLQLTFVLVGVLAVLATMGAISSRIDETTRLLMSVAAMATWGYWSLSALTVTVITETGTRVTESYLGLAALGAVFGAVMLLSSVRLAFGSMDQALNEETPFN